MATKKPSVVRLLDKLKRKAKRNQLEVEDLLAVAACGDPAAISVLDELRATYQWADGNSVGQRRVVPLGRWAKVVCYYLRDGTKGMVDLALSPDAPSLVREMAISVLREITTAESVRSLIQIAGGTNPTNPDERGRSKEVIDAFNILLSFHRGGIFDLNEEEVDEIRSYIHRFLDVANSEGDICIAYCALRSVGNEESLARIRGRPLLEGAFRGLEEIVCKAIKKRLGQRLWAKFLSATKTSSGAKSCDQPSRIVGLLLGQLGRWRS